MLRRSLALLLFTAVVACSPKNSHDGTPVYLDSLLRKSNYVDDLAATYGENLVRKPDSLYEGYGGDNIVFKPAVLFPGTSHEAKFAISELNYNGFRSADISMANAEKEAASNMSWWRTREAWLGMKLSEIKPGDKRKWSVTSDSVYTYPVSISGDSWATLNLKFEPGFMEALRKEFKGDKEIIDSMIFVRDPEIWSIHVWDYQVNPYFDRDPRYIQDKKNEAMTFAEFHRAYIRSGNLEPMESGFHYSDQEYPESLFSTQNVPTSIFKNYKASRDGDIKLICLLPDTSRYYGIVYQFEGSDKVPLGIVTVGKDGKAIANQGVIPLWAIDGCDEQMDGMVDANGSFYGYVSWSGGCVEGDDSEGGEASLSGIVNADGTFMIFEADLRQPDRDLREKPVDAEDMVRHYERSGSTLRESDSNSLLGFESPKTYKDDVWLRPTPLGDGHLVGFSRTFPENERKTGKGWLVFVKNDKASKYPFAMPDGRVLEARIQHDHFVWLNTNPNLYFVLSAPDLFSIEDVPLEECRVHRNWIYAKYGYIFKSADLTTYFSQFDWYEPKHKDVESMLTADDKEIIRVLKQREDIWEKVKEKEK